MTNISPVHFQRMVHTHIQWLIFLSRVNWQTILSSLACIFNTIWARIDPEEGQLGDFEYMLSLADELFCGENNTSSVTCGDVSSLDPVCQLANGSSMERVPPTFSSFESSVDVLFTTTSMSPTSTATIFGNDLNLII